MHSWHEFNHLLAKQTPAWMVSIYTAIVGVFTLENAENVTTLLGWGSLVMGIIVGILTVRNLTLKAALLKSQIQAHTEDREDKEKARSEQNES